MGLFDNFGQTGPHNKESFLGRIGNAAHKLDSNPHWQKALAIDRGENPLQNQYLQQEIQAQKATQAKAAEQARYRQMIEEMQVKGEKIPPILGLKAGMSPSEFKMLQPDPVKRNMYKGADGYNYWQDAPTTRVNPNIAGVDNDPFAAARHKQKLALETDQIKRDRDAQEVDARRQREQAVTDRGVLGDIGSVTGLLSDPELAGSVGFFDNMANLTTGKLFGTDSSRMHGDLSRMLSEDVLDASSKMKGAITEKEWPRLERTRPSLSDQPEQWIDWFTTVIHAVKNNNPHLAEQLDAEIQKLHMNANQNFGYKPRAQGLTPGGSGDDPLGLR